jgi:hypothetical protein
MEEPFGSTFFASVNLIMTDRVFNDCCKNHRKLVGWRIPQVATFSFAFQNSRLVYDRLEYCSCSLADTMFLGSKLQYCHVTTVLWKGGDHNYYYLSKWCRATGMIPAYITGCVYDTRTGMHTVLENSLVHKVISGSPRVQARRASRCNELRPIGAD